MSAKTNHYQILEVSQRASQKEIKLAYRRLVKLFHPDTLSETADRDKIVQINAAYEVLSDPHKRNSYDRQLLNRDLYYHASRRQQRTAEAQRTYAKAQQEVKKRQNRQEDWLKRVYFPVNKTILLILQPLDDRIDDLAADPFDDLLMDDFVRYLEECRLLLDRAKKTLSSQPNPAKFASIAANLYFCIDRIGDGLEELEYFTQNYDDRCLHTGQEMFRIAWNLSDSARASASAFAFSY